MIGAFKRNDRALELTALCYSNYLGKNLISIVLFGSRAKEDEEKASEIAHKCLHAARKIFERYGS